MNGPGLVYPAARRRTRWPAPPDRLHQRQESPAKSPAAAPAEPDI